MTHLTPERLAARQKQIARAKATATPQQRAQAAREAQPVTSGPDGWYLVADVTPSEVDYTEETLAALSTRDGYVCIVAVSRQSGSSSNPGAYLIHFKARGNFHPYTADDIAPALAFLESPDLLRVSIPSLGLTIEPGHTA